MPVCTLVLLALNVPFSELLSALPVKPVTTASVIRWIITPTSISTHLLDTKWDILLLFPTSEGLPIGLEAMISKSWTVKIGVPSRLLSSFEATNKALLNPVPGAVPPLTGSMTKPLIAKSTKGLELTDELANWVQDFSSREGKGAVSMLNLLAFKPDMHDSYLQYGKAFGESVGSRRGGVAKIVGKIVDDQDEGWDEVAIAHYPSISHFADMLASRDYQEINQRYRVPALIDTFILCTTELGMMGLVRPKL